MIRRNQQIQVVEPNSNPFEYEDGENTTVLFKVICSQGKYFIYHKFGLRDPDFCDTTHMVHIVLKTFKQTRKRELAGEVLKSPMEIRNECLHSCLAQTLNTDAKLPTRKLFLLRLPPSVAHLFQCSPNTTTITKKTTACLSPTNSPPSPPTVSEVEPLVSSIIKGSPCLTPGRSAHLSSMAFSSTNTPTMTLFRNPLIPRNLTPQTIY